MAADLELVRRLVRAEHGLAVVATTRPDGTVHASVVNAGVLDDPVTGEPSVGLVAQGGARKLVLMRSSGRAAVVVRSGWQWAAVEGPMVIIGPDDPVDGLPADRLPGLLRRVFAAAGGVHDNWEEYDRVMAEERRAVVLVKPARITGVG